VRLPYGARLKVDEGTKVARGARLADWDPFSIPIVTELGGRVRFEDIVDGMSAKDETDEVTGVSNRTIVDWRGAPRTGDLRPAMVVLGDDGQPLRLSNGQEARYTLAVGAILSVSDGDDVRPGDVLARIATGGAKTRDITGGLPRVAELFEARRPKDAAVIAELDGQVEFGRDYKNKRRIRIVPDDELLEPREYLIPKGKHIAVQDGDRVRKGEYILDGNPAPQDILEILGVEALADYLVNEIQKVYRLQGVPINDKHIEVIVRQMLQKVEIVEEGDTEFLKGEHVDELELADENARMRREGLREASGKAVLLGITKASLQTRSFISAASFQETTRVLTDAAVNGKIDTLDGLKENVIVGRLIPAGTGGQLRRYRRVAAERDLQLVAERAGGQAGAEALPADIAAAAAKESAMAK
jgi:DNA-directed RNA polymerase subunit beta'